MAGKQYVVAEGWSHIFDDGERGVRFVFDTNANKLIFMDVQRWNGWKAASAAEIADVEDSLKNANGDALENPEDSGLDASETLPEWAVLPEASPKTVKPQRSPSPGM